MGTCDGYWRMNERARRRKSMAVLSAFGAKTESVGMRVKTSGRNGEIARGGCSWTLVLRLTLQAHVPLGP